MLFQNGALFSALTVAQNVRVPFLEHLDLSPKLVGDLIDGLTPPPEQPPY